MRGQLRSLISPLVLSYLGTMLILFTLPSIRPIGYVGFLTLALATLPFPKALWIAAATGIFIDISSVCTPMGFFALNYCLTALIVYRYRNFFSREKIYMFALYSSLFSFVSTLIHFILYGLVDLQLKLSFFTLITDLFLMPIFDGVYALVVVLSPLALWSYLTNEARLRKFESLKRRLRYKSLVWWKKSKALLWKKPKTKILP